MKISGFKDFKYDMDMDMLDMKDMDMVDMDKQGLGPKGSSVDSILSFFRIFRGEMPDNLKNMAVEKFKIFIRFGGCRLP